eukprot:1906854-Pyramimonas_sp.AAC.1
MRPGVGGIPVTAPWPRVSRLANLSDLPGSKTLREFPLNDSRQGRGRAGRFVAFLGAQALPALWARARRRARRGRARLRAGPAPDRAERAKESKRGRNHAPT